MKEIKFRDLRAEELECRVGSTNESGFSLLLYKTARADANVLDETVGVANWQCKYYQVKNTMVCSIGININYDDENKEPYWIWKDDGGDDDYQAEKVKGELSDAFKRSSFRYSIGRKLYESPFIWINKDSNNDPKKTRYAVAQISYSETGVTKLVIVNAKNNEVVFQYPKYDKKPTQAQKEPKNNDLDSRGSVSMKEINASVTSMEYVSPLDSDDMAYIKEYYNKLPNERKERFEIWLFTEVQETKIDMLNDNKAKIIATKLREKGN